MFGVRGIVFPFLLKICRPFGVENQIFLLALMFIFYLITLYFVVKIYKACKEVVSNKKMFSVFYIIGVLFLVVLNPIIFAYFHTVMPEFVSITLIIIVSFLSWKWIDVLKNKKFIVVFMLLTILIYHLKPSYIMAPFISIMMAAIISLMKNFNKINFLYKFFTLVLCVLGLLISIFIWNFAMKEANVVENTFDRRVNGRIVSGINTLDLVYDSSTNDEFDIDMYDIVEEDKNKMEEILNKRDGKEKFVIYKTSNDKYIVYFKSENNFSEQIEFLGNNFFGAVADIIKSYKKGYRDLIFVKDINQFSKKIIYGYFKENFSIPKNLFSYKENVTHVITSGYDEYFENYRKINEENFINKFYNKLEMGILFSITVFTKISLYYFVPVLFVISFLVFIIFRKKLDLERMKLLELIMVLYAETFGFLMCYVIFNATVDRYIVPILIPSYIADIIVVFLVISVLSKEKKVIE